MLITITTDCKQKSNTIEGKIKLSISQHGKLTRTTVVEIKRDVCGLIRLHGDAKQLSEMKFQIIQAKKMFFLS